MTLVFQKTKDHRLKFLRKIDKGNKSRKFKIEPSEIC